MSSELNSLRDRLEDTDRQLIDLISRRLELAREAGTVKREAGLPTLDPGREAEVVRRAGVMAREAGIPPEGVREIFWHLIGLCRRIQSEEERTQ